MDWLGFILAFVVFFLSHSLPLRPPLRQRVEKLLGRRGFSVTYSLVSVAILAWLIIAADHAPDVQLWIWAPWQSVLALACTAAACLLIALAVGRPNPFSFGGPRDARFNPARPGIVRLTRHPLLTALALWAGAHLLANGDLAHVILFGIFSAFALLGKRMIDARKRRALGAEWERLHRKTRAQPLRPNLWPATPAEAVRVGAGLALFVLLLSLHPVVIGASPFP